MEFLITLMAVGAIGWILASRIGKPKNHRKMPVATGHISTPGKTRDQAPALYNSMQELPYDLRELVLRIEQTPWDTHSTEKQELRNQLTDMEYELRNKYRLRWNGENSAPPPIQAMTQQQRRVLSYAATLHAIQIEREESIELNRNVFSGPKKTVNSLVRHGLLRLDQHGVYRITQAGLHALEALRTRFD